MSFVSALDTLPLTSLVDRARTAPESAVRSSLARTTLSLADFANLISPAASGHLETMGRRSHALTVQRFGQTIRLFAPLYLSSECVNNCVYCGFSRKNTIRRVTLSVDEVVREARALKAEGFRNILLVAGEHPKFVSNRYVRDCVAAVHAEVPSVSLEIGPLDVDAYRHLVEAGADGLVVYQETYDRALYASLHPSGPKRNFDRRLETPERAYAAGFRRIGIGALYGLADWRADALSLAAHALYLLRHCWKAYLTISLPRLRPCAGAFQPLTHLGDRDLAQLVCAFRLLLPDVGLVLSTREPARLRDGLIPLGITLISAGSHTEPGGYSGAGREKTHVTRGGRMFESVHDPSQWTAAPPGITDADVQFAIADQRSASEVSARLRDLGYEPVWKDWDSALTPSRNGEGEGGSKEERGKGETCGAKEMA
ncbi:MAG: 2-iminoacetate synthase ThiH [Verrucomicrobia bacterium]|nr:2-iminoacetate synthase ThiH [Verrucomicrobiota bacterium]OQC64411.1 MAG: 2-iminoacetate synthase [Verrucomicrobia bacterium ADurb.Bin006]MDI9379504.1 2-iminoacetate synthase ThiH [Verrucomicrobiota bacterium]NMD19513.1 2-iminoacetate synthase ThiH [Verrucomicrobiota bacterium]HNV00715.1 2-iminoacetate synthase ThiH [Verrucomicrobiota bacterium]